MSRPLRRTTTPRSESSLDNRIWQLERRLREAIAAGGGGGTPGSLLFQWNGALVTGRAIEYTARRPIAFREVCVRVNTPGSTQSTFVVYVNLVIVQTVIVPASTSFVPLSAPIALRIGDTISAGCTQVGTGAANALIQVEESA